MTRVRQYGNSGSNAEFATSESRGLPNSAGGREHRGTRGAEVLPVRCPGNSCLLSRTLETGSKSSWLSGRLSLWVLSLACVGWSCVRWSVVLVLGAVVWSSCRVWSSGPVSGLVPGTCFFLFSEKRRRPRAPTQGPVFRQVPPLRPRYSWPTYLCRGIGGFYSYFPIVLSFHIFLLRRCGVWVVCCGRCDLEWFLPCLIADAKRATSNEIDDPRWRTFRN